MTRRNNPPARGQWKPGWRWTRCYCHHGIVQNPNTLDPDPIEHDDCHGQGVIAIRPSGHCFLFPGGPALGMWGESFYEAGWPIDAEA